MIRWFQTRNGLQFYGVAEPMIGDRPLALTIIRRGRIERIHLGIGVLDHLVEIPYAQLPVEWRATVHDWFWRQRA